MRVLFTSVPAYGHVLPMLPLARAAQAAGAQVALATAPAFADVVAPLPLLPAGPAFPVIVEEFSRRTEAPPVTQFDPAAFGELFGAVRIDLTYSETLAAAREWRADLVVADREDFVGPLVAAELGVPWARFLLGLNLPPDITSAITARAQQRYHAAGLSVAPPAATLDPWPVALQPEGWHPAADRIVIRPEPHTDGHPVDAPTPPVDSTTRHSRAKVLVTTGTIADDAATVAAIVDALVSDDLDVVVTGRHGRPWPLDVNPARVRQVGFAPLAQLLAGVDAAVVAGGAGTVLGALARAVPLVIVPLVFDQRVTAERVAAVGAAVITDQPTLVPAAVHQVLTDNSIRTAAQSMSQQIAAMDSPEEAWRRLSHRTRLPSEGHSPKVNKASSAARSARPGRLPDVSLTIRDAAPEDAAALARLAGAAMRATYAPIAQAAVYEAMIAQTCTREAFEATVELKARDERAILLVAFRDGTLEGFLDFGPDEDGVPELRRLYTAAGRTSRGTGAALVDTLERQLPVGTVYRAVVHARNERGLAFWVRHGFVMQGEVDTYAHFTEHRGLDLEPPAEREPSLMLRRTVTPIIS